MFAFCKLVDIKVLFRYGDISGDKSISVNDNMSRKLLYTDVGGRIRSIREKLGLTQPVFAKSLGVGHSWLSELENGKYKPSDVWLVAIEYRYNINPQWILTGEGSMYLEFQAVREGRAGYPEDESVEHLLDMTRYVLNAGHPEITLALEQDIIAFHGAVLKDQRVREQQKVHEKNS